VNGHGVNLRAYSSILVEIKFRAQQRGETTFIQEQKDFNVEAHNLARVASSLWVVICGPSIDSEIHVNYVNV
jgi:hypothetical protein